MCHSVAAPAESHARPGAGESRTAALPVLPLCPSTPNHRVTWRRVVPGFLKLHNHIINVSGNVAGNVLAIPLAMISKPRAAVAKPWQQVKGSGHIAEAVPARAAGRPNGIDA